MTKEMALTVIWSARDGLCKPDVSREIAAAFNYNGRLPLKNLEQLRNEGVWLEEDGKTMDLGQGVSLVQSFIPEGCVTCELAEAITGLGEPKIWPSFTAVKDVLNWRTQRALADGFHWKPENVMGWVYFR